jgi:ubiquinone/menaquinone biosynthesis C-methylase UbiE
MNHADHLQLIAAGVERTGGLWADIGAGSGAFTLALRDLAGPDVDLIAVDRDRAGLQILRTTMERRFPGTRLRLLEADMAGHLALPPLDGIMAANAIHYIPDQKALLRRWKDYLKPEGRLIVVEYDAETGNRWVPYPLSFASFGEIARAAGFAAPVLLATRPSRWLGRIYSALAFPTAEIPPAGTPAPAMPTG